MKKIFFYSNIILNDKSSGITKKVYAQIDTLRNMGYVVYYSGYLDDGVAVLNNNDEIIYCDKYFTENSRIQRFIRRWQLLNTVKKFLISTREKFNYAYLRFHFFDYSYLNVLKKFHRKGTKVIVEAHSFPYRNKKISLLALTHIIDYIYEPFARKYIDSVAAISNHENIWNCKTIHIDNAINLNNTKLQEKESDNENCLRLISVSNERYYHGYPKIIKGLADYYNKEGNYNIKIYFVGEFSLKTKQLVDNLKLENHVFFLGKLSGIELEEAFNNADLGIGALTSKAGAEYGSSIKTKEYFAKGLPFINGWKEYAFDDSYPYVKRFSLNDEYIEFGEVIKFYDSIKNDSNMQVSMREFCKQHYTWESQFRKVFSET